AAPSQCAGVKCYNGGICEVIQSNAKCRCRRGYFGKYCYKKKTCRNTPCQNGGKCKGRERKAKCHCRRGYTGKFCQKKRRQSCDSFKCRNGGTCVMRRSKPKCRCPPYIFGKKCQRKKKCYRIHCQNGGTCKGGEKYAKCHCRPGYGGNRCERRVENNSKCNQFRCYNGGECMVMKSNPKCYCNPPYYGNHCQKKRYLTPCQVLRCSNGGTCTVNGTKARCDCPPGYYGMRCQRKHRDIEATCESFKCYNGGECKMVKSRPKCICPPTFDGTRCKFPVKYGLYPSLKGHGYIRLPEERLNVKSFTLKIVFRPNRPFGLLLFASKNRSDFFSITLEEDHIDISQRAGLEISIHYIILNTAVKYGLYPSLKGHGYIRLPEERLNVKSFTLKIVFRPNRPFGLLLFASKNRSDFFSITLEEDHIDIRYVSGLGLNKIRSSNQVQPYEWNTLIIIRKNETTMARLNYGDSKRVNDRVGNAISHDNIYLGGYSDFSAIARKVHTEKGFHGCIKEIHINNNQIVFSLQQPHNFNRWNTLNFLRKWKQLGKGLKQKVLGKRLGELFHLNLLAQMLVYECIANACYLFT
ncbi:neurogenic locus notch protein 1, partial [Plakobranchus ocellatus]